MAKDDGSTFYRKPKDLRLDTTLRENILDVDLAGTGRIIDPLALLESRIQKLLIGHCLLTKN